VRLMAEGLEGIQHVGRCRSSVMSDGLRERGEREVFSLPMSGGQASREGGVKVVRRWGSELREWIERER